MERVSLIGPGDIEFHYIKVLGFTKEKLFSELEKIAESLVASGVEVELLPDRGISFEIAKIYRKKGGLKVVGAVPKSDRAIGIEHLKEYMETKVDGDPLFDEMIDTGDWFKHDLIKALLGDTVLYLGSSPGADGEFNYAVYLYKLFSGFKDGVEVAGKRIHPEIRAGKNYTIIVYSPFFSQPLPKEKEEYLKEFGINLVYVDNPEELEQKLHALRG